MLLQRLRAILLGPVTVTIIIPLRPDAISEVRG